MGNVPEGPSNRSRNSFDLLRLIAASAVLWSHQHALLTLPEPVVPGLATTYGGFGVYIFFAISGYLNAGSLLRGQSSPRFLLNRVLRIYPALVACVVFMICLGAAATSLTMRDFWLDGSVSVFALRNMTLLFGVSPALPGVFEESAFPRSMNGSLWTLPYEVDLYILLAAVLAVCRYRTYAIYVLFAVAGIYLAFFAVGADARRVLPGVLVGHLAIFALLFFAGALMATCERDGFFALGPGLCITIAAMALVLQSSTLGRLLAFAAIVILLGRLALPPWLAPKIDLSYGIYLYAFPVQQIVVAVTTDFWIAFVSSAAATVGLAYISNKLIETPALQLKASLRKAEYARA